MGHGCRRRRGPVSHLLWGLWPVPIHVRCRPVVRGCGAARPDGAEALNLGGPSAAIHEVVAAIEAACPESAGTIRHEEVALPFPAHLDDSGLRRLLGDVTYAPLVEGVAASIDLFRRLIAEQKVAPRPVPTPENGRGEGI